MQDDGFGSEAAQRLERRELPPGVTVMDFGSGGLDLAYEIMRGYHALVLIDVSRQGGEPGTLYVIEPDPADYARPIEDGEMISPHGMDPQTVLRFVTAVGRFSGKVVVVACEPGPIEDLARRPQPRGRAGRREGARRRDGADRASCRPTRRTRVDARAGDLLRGARVGAPARGRAAGVRGQAARRAPAPGRAGLARVLLGDRDPRTASARAPCWSRSVIAARLECTACAREWEIELPVFRCPTCGGADVRVAAGDELEVESIEVEEEPACTA